VKIPANPKFAGKEIDIEGIIPGTIASLKMMLDIALGSDEEAEYYLKRFIEAGLLGTNTPST
jgi:hypothetical protein